jgi:hypothetical protein
LAPFITGPNTRKKVRKEGSFAKDSRRE